MRSLLPLAVLLVLTPAARADQDGDGVRLGEAVRTGLRSGDPAEQAWSAFRAGRHRVANTGPLLVDVLRQEERLDLEPESFALRAVTLDALIRTETPVRAEDLLPHARGSLVPAVLILLARSPERNRPALTRLFDELEEGDTDAWLAAGNLLFGGSAPGFAARVLTRLETEVEIRVFSREGRYRGPSGGVTGCGRTRPPEGFPPLVIYKLSGPPPEDWPETLPPLLPHSLLADGPRPIHSRRVESDVIWTCTSGDPPDRDDCRAEWIAALLRRIDAEPPEGGIRAAPWWRMNPLELAGKIGPPALVRIDLRWAGAPPLLRQTRRECEALHVTYRDCVRRLHEAGLVSDRELHGFRPRIRIRFRDFREDRRAPLPEPSAPPEWKPPRKGLPERRLR